MQFDQSDVSEYAGRYQLTRLLKRPFKTAILTSKQFARMTTGTRFQLQGLFIIDGDGFVNIHVLARFERANCAGNVIRMAQRDRHELDSRIIDPDFAHRDIRTELLLESELRGYVEDPDYYFGERTPERMAAAEALMLTQGWRRYDIPKVLQGVYAEPELPLEIGQEITGRLEKTGLFRGRNFKGYAVSALVPRFGAFFRTEVERDGSFALNGFDMPDSTHFVLRAEGPGGKTDVVLAADPQTWPEADAPLPRPDRRERMRRYDRSVASFTDSLKHILIEEVVVSASQKPLEPITNPYQVLARTSVDYKTIEEEGYTDLEELLMRQHGVHIRGDVVYAYGNPARYMIDGTLWMSFGENYPFIPVEMIKRIDIIPAVNTALFGITRTNRSSAGKLRINSWSIIAITTKDGSELPQGKGSPLEIR